MPHVEMKIDLERARRVIDAAQREVDAYADGVDSDEFQELIEMAERLLIAVTSLLHQRDQATKRERIASEAYFGQQNSHRELEALYQSARTREKTVDDIRRDYAYGLFNFYRTIFPQRPIEGYEQALAVIEREWNGMHADAVAMAKALEDFFSANEVASHPYDLLGHISPMEEALSAWELREQNNRSQLVEEAKEVSE